jgi:hypothetical protein
MTEFQIGQKISTTYINLQICTLIKLKENNSYIEEANPKPSPHMNKVAAAAISSSSGGSGRGGRGVKARERSLAHARRGRPCRSPAWALEPP